MSVIERYAVLIDAIRQRRVSKFEKQPATFGTKYSEDMNVADPLRWRYLEVAAHRPGDRGLELRRLE